MIQKCQSHRPWGKPLSSTQHVSYLRFFLGSGVLDVVGAADQQTSVSSVPSIVSRPLVLEMKAMTSRDDAVEAHERRDLRFVHTFAVLLLTASSTWHGRLVGAHHVYNPVSLFTNARCISTSRSYQ